MKTEEQARELLGMAATAQRSVQAFDMPCPRCGENRMNPVAVRNALSRYADVHICDICGQAEAIMAHRGERPLPLNQWAFVKAFDSEVER